MNVSCNIFINSFGSIAETTMVSKKKKKEKITAQLLSPIALPANAALPSSLVWPDENIISLFPSLPNIWVN